MADAERRRSLRGPSLADDLYLGGRSGGVLVGSTSLAEVHCDALRRPDRDLL